ncbi:MAG: hypothetical protein Q8N88_06885 [Nanoarchaeota archaeon]|nr:hypothetical protein [Nanoarchaeota archaeon]
METNKEKLLQPAPEELVKEMAEKGFRPVGKEVLKAAYGEERTKEQVEQEIEEFYSQGRIKVEVELVDADKDSVYVFIKNKV